MYVNILLSKEWSLILTQPLKVGLVLVTKLISK